MKLNLPQSATASPLSPPDTHAHGKPPKSNAAPKRGTVAWRVARTYLAPYKWHMALAVLASLVYAGSSAAGAAVMQPLVNKMFVGAPPAGAFVYIPIAVVLIAIVRSGASLVQNWTVNSVGNWIVGDMQVELFGKVVRSDLARLRSRHSGEVVSSMLYDATLVRNAASTAALNTIKQAATLVGMLVVMFRQDPLLSVSVLLAGPLIGAIIQRFTRWTKKAAQGAMAGSSALSSAILEGVDGIKVVKIDNREGYEQARVATAVRRRQAFVIKGANIGGAISPVIEVVGALVVAGAIAFAGWRHAQGHLNVGQFVAFLVALLGASEALRQLSSTQTAFAEGFAAAERMFDTIDVVPAIADTKDAKPIDHTARQVALDGVTFAYAGTDEAALNNVSLVVERGETIALVGPSGGGKSTILNLIPRFYDVTGGAVTIDGADLRALTLASVRDQIALVTQEPFLFDDTIRANIAYARPDASQAEIEAAAQQAAAHDFITAFPAGYDTSVGEAGARLSGGQRQRVAIARAFLKNAPILLLDEATSALDTESEAQVQAALERLMQGRATILIAHRLSTVKNADRIYVIDKGRVVETGSHTTLLRKGGLYARLARSQNLEPASEAAE